MNTKTITIKLRAETQTGEPWSPQTDAHLSYIVKEKLGTLHYEIIKIEEEV